MSAALARLGWAVRLLDAACAPRPAAGQRGGVLASELGPLPFPENPDAIGRGGRSLLRGDVLVGYHLGIRNEAELKKLVL